MARELTQRASQWRGRGDFPAVDASPHEPIERGARASGDPSDRDAGESGEGATTAMLRGLPVGGPRTAFDAQTRVDLQREQRIMGALFGDEPTAIKIGRYTLLDRLGAGGMGSVYSAYDDRLERKIAVKLLHNRGEPGAEEVLRARLIREGKAMARLSHPNIVTVHEAGECEGQLFIAMEYVRGESLDRWIRGDEPRPWREVLAVFDAAGRGLAAAHKAGIVHRDFKPHNVLLGPEGVVKVADFGLARALEGSEVDGGTPRSSSGARFDPGLTRSGAVLGTPAYMSPEQVRGQPASERSDQFNFCAALYEGLYGQLPFSGRTIYQLVNSIESGAIREPPARARVPARVQQVVYRGLSVDPEARFASMEELLDALREPDSAGPRRARRVAALAAALAAGLSINMALDAGARSDAPGLCEDSAQVLAEVWSESRVARARSAFEGMNDPLAEETWARVKASVDRYADEWTELHTRTCLLRARGALPQDGADGQSRCLDRGLASLEELLRVIEQPDMDAVLSAVTAVDELPSPRTCLEPARNVPPASIVDDVRALEDRLARIEMRAELGRRDAIDLAKVALEDARRVGYEPLIASASLVLGSALIERQAEPDLAFSTLYEALNLALANHEDELAAEAIARRVFVLAELLEQPSRALEDEGLARSFVRRAGEDSTLRWLLENNLAVARENHGEFASADEAYARAADEARARGREGADPLARTLLNAGQLAIRRGQIERAEDLLRSAQEGFTNHLGAHHPHALAAAAVLADAQLRRGRLIAAQRQLVSVQERLAAAPAWLELHVALLITDAERALGRLDAARRSAERALAIAEQRRVPDAQHALADTLTALGDHDAAIALHERALAGVRARDGIDGYMVGRSLEALGDALLAAGDARQALEVFDEAWALRASSATAEPPELASAYVHQARALVQLGRLDEARAGLELAAQLFAGVADQLNLSRVELQLAELDARSGDAVQGCRRAVFALDEIARALDPSAPELARARASLARLLDATPACEATLPSADPALLIEQARDSYTTLGEGFTDERDELTRWLEGRSRS